jgi:hypothetical protein
MESSPPRQTVMTYVDRPEIPETFADCLGRVTADAVHVRLEFCINRLDHLVVIGAKPRARGCRVLPNARGQATKCWGLRPSGGAQACSDVMVERCND